MSIHSTLHRSEIAIVAPIREDEDQQTQLRTRRADAAPGHPTVVSDGPTEVSNDHRSFETSIPRGSFQGVRFAAGEPRPGLFGFLEPQ